MWDTILYQLAIERVIADRYGKTDDIKNINNALKTARYFRSEASYIRSVSDAVRMTLRAPDLQQTDLLSVQNILNKSPVPNPDEFENRILSKLSRQYWHNINRVAVKGGGDVNYVVVKDDIGNWYVKNYSEDKSEIYNAIRGVAMYNYQKSNNLSPLGITKDSQLKSPMAKSLERIEENKKNKLLSLLVAVSNELCAKKLIKDENENGNPINVYALDKFTKLDDEECDEETKTSGQLKKLAVDKSWDEIAELLYQRPYYMATKLKENKPADLKAIDDPTKIWKGLVETYKQHVKSGEKILNDWNNFVMNYSQVISGT